MEERAEIYRNLYPKMYPNPGKKRIGASWRTGGGKGNSDQEQDDTHEAANSMDGRGTRQNGDEKPTTYDNFSTMFSQYY